MSNARPDEPFEKLPGIGPARASRLRAAGIESWAALGDVVDVLAGIRAVDAERLRILRDDARTLAAEDAGDNSPDGGPLGADGPGEPGSGAVGERTNSFLVRVHQGTDGDTTRCSITDVAADVTETFAGLALTDIVAFVEQHVDPPIPGRSGDDSGDPEAGFEKEVGSEEEAGSEEEMRPEKGVVGAGPVDHSSIAVDGGRVVGGGERPIVVEWDTGSVGAGEGQLRYRALLGSRPYGGAPPLQWQLRAAVAGAVSPPETAELDFGPIDLPSGVHRLQVAIEVDR